jgi:hypothetical protein
MTSAAKYLAQIEAQLEESWLPRIYSERILKMRTRAYQFPAMTKDAKADIQHTLLGIELRVGKSRMLCPDLATARYLGVFARLGCKVIAIPYDITKISQLADELESSWHRMLLLSDRLPSDRSAAFRARVRRQLIGKVRDEIAEAGVGTRVPDFKQTTRQTDKPQRGARSTREKQ